MSVQTVVIAGAGQAGFQTAESLRRGGFDGRIILAGAERYAPYQRPPLSKAHLAQDAENDRLSFRPEAFYADQNIELRLNTTITALNSDTRRATFDNGTTEAFDHAVIATGAEVRRLSTPGAETAPIHYLRGIDDAAGLRAAASGATRVLIIGGGFIGLEVAAVFASQGKSVTVLEAAPRVLARVAAPVISDFYARTHAAHGVQLRTNTTVERFDASPGGPTRAVLNTGETVEADLVVAGIGVTPRTGLAIDGGLEVGRGVRVDASGRCSKPGFYAAGDCAEGENTWVGAAMVLESVQNAIDQAKVVADAILGRPRTYDAAPWFWSDQYDLKLQMAGLSMGTDESVLRGAPEDGAFSVFYFRQGQLRSVDSVNRPGDHMAARKLLQLNAPLTPAQAGDMSFDLREAIKTAQATA